MLKQFGILPGERRARALKRRDYLYCLLNLCLDEEEKVQSLCPVCRAQAAQARCARCGAPLDQGENEENEAFDMARYRALKEGGTA